MSQAAFSFLHHRRPDSSAAESATNWSSGRWRIEQFIGLAGFIVGPGQCAEQAFQRCEIVLYGSDERGFHFVVPRNHRRVVAVHEPGHFRPRLRLPGETFGPALVPRSERGVSS